MVLGRAPVGVRIEIEGGNTDSLRLRVGGVKRSMGGEELTWDISLQRVLHISVIRYEGVLQRSGALICLEAVEEEIRRVGGGRIGGRGAKIEHGLVGRRGRVITLERHFESRVEFYVCEVGEG